MGFLEDVREAASAEAWSRGVQFARDGRVVIERAEADEVKAAVEMPGRVVPHEVHLWPADTEWSCDCESPADVCAHVTATVIAWNQTRTSEPWRPPVVEAVPHVGYRFRRERNDELSLDRAIVTGEKEEPLAPSLVAVVRNRRILTRQADLELDELLRYRPGTTLPRQLVPKVLDHLRDLDDVRLDGAPIRAGSAPVVPLGRVEDDGLGFRVRVVRDPAIEEVFRNGLVRCGDELRAVSDGALSPEQRQILGRGVSFEPGDVGKLVGEVIPDLRKKVPVEIRTARLPEGEGTRPRILLDTKVVGHTLSVLPLIVYGEPPIARVDRGELVLLGKVIPVRSERIEKQLRSELAERLGLAVGIRKELGGSAGVALMHRAQQVHGVEIAGDGARAFQEMPAIEPKVRIDGRRLEIDFGDVDPETVIDAWQANEPMVPLRGAGWAPLPVDWLEQHGQLLIDLLGSRAADGTVARHATFALAELAAKLDEPPPPDLDKLKALLADFTTLPEPRLPADLRADLRPYQKVGVQWLSFLREAGLGGILADDMGLGKTVQALAAIEAPALVVCPTSVLDNWRSETNRFRPALRVAVYHGTQRTLDDADVTITSYALLRLDADVLSKRRWKSIVLDEAQAVKNPESQVAQAAMRLQGDFKLALTGTPVENRLDELWSELHFTNPGLLGGRRDFQERTALPVARGERGAVERLRARIKPFVLRRRKGEVAPELPPRTEMVLRCTLGPSERAVYDAVRASGQRAYVEAVQAGNVLGALEILLRLRQAACHIGLVPGQDDPPSSSKLDLLRETLEEIVAEGHRALVFSQWTSLLDRVEPVLAEAGLDRVRLDGSTRDRAAVVEAFQAPDGPPVFLLSLKAGGVGLNLTAADHVILLDPWWNPAVEDQAADRAHRIGQDKPVLVLRLVAENTVEERLLALQDKKRSLAEAALGEADRAAQVTKDDLLSLFA
jgi:superfamily II DNA or RNA helicase